MPKKLFTDGVENWIKRLVFDGLTASGTGDMAELFEAVELRFN